MKKHTPRQLVTIMLSFSFFGDFFCDDNFSVFLEKELRHFFSIDNMATLATEITPKIPKIFRCNSCDFYTSNKKDFGRHVKTVKHNFGNLATLATQITPKNPTLKCSRCSKEYKDKSGLWRHRKKCPNEPDKKDEQNGLIEFLIKENSEFKQLVLEQNKTMIELAKNVGQNGNNITNNNTTNNNTTNNTNHHFNLNFYLNETCKNAMNIMDFVNQLPISIKNLEDTGRLGFAEGISKIFIDGLNEIDDSDRPIHCSDTKREVLYIRNNDEWNKETDNKLLLTNAIKHVAHKNIKQISEWVKIHPDCTKADSNKNDKYLKIVCESMSGSSEEESNKNYSKIIKNIVRETAINKSHANSTY